MGWLGGRMARPQPTAPDPSLRRDGPELRRRIPLLSGADRGLAARRGGGGRGISGAAEAAYSQGRRRGEARNLDPASQRRLFRRRRTLRRGAPRIGELG